jgi:hypothetical protein
MEFCRRWKKDILGSDVRVRARSYCIEVGWHILAMLCGDVSECLRIVFMSLA